MCLGISITLVITLYAKKKLNLKVNLKINISLTVVLNLGYSAATLSPSSRSLIDNLRPSRMFGVHIMVL
jgi:hypothetical protein